MDGISKLLSIFALILIVAAYLILKQEELVCAESKKVVRIESIGYRGGNIVFEDGSAKHVNQPRPPIVVGQMYCTEYKRSQK